MSYYIFNLTKPIIWPEMGPDPSDFDIENEPMFVQSSTEFVSNTPNARITYQLLDLLEHRLTPEEWSRLRIDTRSHMLMPGWYPCIPGWHCDFMFAEPDGSQRYDPSLDRNVRHFMWISSGPSTEFINGQSMAISDGKRRIFWKDVDFEIRNDFKNLSLYKVPARTMIEFNSNELHRGTPWDGPPKHWRYFFRATLFPKNHPYANEKYFKNKVRKQTQVYCDVHAGW